MSPILVTLTSRSDSDFDSSNVSLKENKPDGVNLNSNDIDYYIRKNEGKALWFSADCSLAGCKYSRLCNKFHSGTLISRFLAMPARTTNKTRLKEALRRPIRSKFTFQN